VSEAIGLDDKDVELNEVTLSIRPRKNGKCRFIPLSPCVAERLSAYSAERNRLLGTGRVTFFLLENSERLSDCCARYNFALVCQRIGLRDRQAFNRHDRRADTSP
jgi:integrase/recombinase XerD